MMMKRKNLPVKGEAHRAMAPESRSPNPMPDRSRPFNLVPKQASEELFQLQLEQFHHDEIYHREISRLTVHQRLNHMALHFSKYSGQIAEICRTADDEALQRVITDIFIIGMCSANSLNIRIADQFKECATASVHDLAKLGEALAKEEGVKKFDTLWLLQSMTIAAGRMAKGCESIDHLEPFPFNEHIKESVVEILKTTLIATSLRGLDLASAVRARLDEVKKRFIFHGYL